MNNQKNFGVYSHNKNNFINERNDQLPKPNDNLTSSSSTTTTNNIVDAPNNYYYSHFKTPKKNILPIHQAKNINQIPTSKTTIYSKGKIQKAITNTANSFNTNNIIINNNTNIINNNNTNIINNNISNNLNDKDYARSISQLNIEQINELTKNYNNQAINKTIFPKKQIINKKKIIKKNNIIIKNTNIINKNVINNNLTCGNNFDDKQNNYKNDNYNMTESNANKSQENNTILNVEEILMIEEKLSSLINCLVNFNPCTEECFECLNFYFTTKLSKNLNKYFIKENYLQIIKKAMKLKLFAYILCYDISLNEENFPSFIVNLDELFGYVHNILILISKYFCNKISNNDNSNIWVKKLQNLIHSYDPDKKNVNMIFEEINLYCFKLTDNLYPQILQKYNQKKIIDFYSKINVLTQENLYILFRDKIFVNNNLNGSIITTSTYFQENKNLINGLVPPPYLKYKTNKKYTLVLDLDETLIHFKVNPKDDSSGILQFRPYISEFLSSMSKFYELVIFTAATQDYADPIINAIEQKGTTFQYRLYRIHTIIINNDFVKDLSRLGRDMSKVIIVDNMEQNYKLQPDNGITIRPFWGKDTSDMALYDLMSILVKIAGNNMDVRDGIRKFKEDIISKVTSNIFRRVQN